MALYRLAIRTVSRGKGAVSVAVAAYISGSRFHNLRELTTYDFTWRQDVVFTELVGNYGRTSEELWNLAERRELRWDGVTAREQGFQGARILGVAERGAERWRHVAFSDHARAGAAASSVLVCSCGRE
jgi:hypothetical protein